MSPIRLATLPPHLAAVLTAMLATLLFATTTHAQSKTWTGTVSADWHTAGNWSPSGVPVTTSQVVIPAGTGSVTISSTNVTVQSLAMSRPLTLSRTLTTGSASIASTLTLSSAATLSGTITINSGGTLAFPAGCNYARLTNLTINGNLSVASGGIGWKNVTLNGSLAVTGSTYTLFAFDGNNTLSSPISMTGSGTTDFNQITAGTLTIAPTGSISGGKVSFNSNIFCQPNVAMILVNNGTITAAVAGQTITINSNVAIANNGTVTAISGSVVIGSSLNPTLGTYAGNNVTFGGTLDLAGSTWALSGRVFGLAAGATLQNGSVDLTTGALRFPAPCQSARLFNLSIIGDLNVATAGIRWSNVSLSGAMNITGGGSRIAFEGDTTINFPIVANSNGDTDFNQYFAGTLTISPAGSISGGGFRFGSNCGSAAMAVVNNGTITSNINGRAIQFNFPLTNTGTITASGGSVTISGSLTNTGTIDSTLGPITINSNINLSAINYPGNNFVFGGTVDLGGGAWNLAGCSVTLGANSTVQNGTISTAGGVLIFPTPCSYSRLVNINIVGDLDLVNGGVRLSNVGVSGSINVSGSSQSTVAFEGDNTLSRPLSLTNAGLTYINQATAGTLTIEPGVTITGGNVMFNTGCSPFAAMTLVNNGTITAAVGKVVILGSNVTLVNNGTVASNDGLVSINGPFNPFAGTYTGNNFTLGGTVDLGGATWNLAGKSYTLRGTTIITNGTLLTTGGTLTLPRGCDRARLSDLVINGDLNVNDGNIRLTNVVLNGVLRVTGSSSSSITFVGDTTIDFPVIVSNSGQSYCELGSTGILTIGATGSVSGGTIRFAQTCESAPVPVVNNGIITSETVGGDIRFRGPLTNNSIITADGGSVTFSHAFANAGTIDSTRGAVYINNYFNNFDPFVGTYLGNNFTIDGTTDLGGANWNFAGKTIAFGANSTIQNGSISTTGGTLTFPAPCNYTRLANLTINGDLNLVSGGLRWSNVILNGSLNISGSNNSLVAFEGNNTLSFPVSISSTGTTYFNQATAGTLTIPPSGVISGGNIGFNTACSAAAMTLVNNGSIVAAVSGRTVTFNTNVTLVNNGTVSAAIGSVSVRGLFSPFVGSYPGNNLILGGNTDLGGNSWSLAGRSITLLGGATIQNGTLNLSGGTLAFPSQCNFARLANLTINGNLNLTPGSIRWSNVALNGTLSISGAAQSNVAFEGNNSINFPVIVNASAPAFFSQAVAGILTIAPTGSITGGALTIGNNCFSRTMSVVNNGSVDANIAGRSITVSVPYSGPGQLWGSVILNALALSAPFATALPTNNAVFSGIRTAPAPGAPTTLAFRSLDILPNSTFNLGSTETLNLGASLGLARVGSNSTFNILGTFLGTIVSAGRVNVPIANAALLTITRGGTFAISPPATLPPPGTPVTVPFAAAPIINDLTLLQVGGSGIGSSTGTTAGSNYQLTTTGVTNRGITTWDGRLAITGSFTQPVGGAMRLFVAGPIAGDSYSQLTIGQAANISGILQVVLQPEHFNYLPAVGDTFDFVQAAGGITLPVAPATLTVQTLMTLAGAQRLGITLPPFNTGIASDPGQLVSLPANLFTYTLAPGGQILRLTLAQPICLQSATTLHTGSCQGGQATFSVTPASSGPTTFQWQTSPSASGPWTDLADGPIANLGAIAGAQTQSLVINNTLATAAGFTFRCVITSPCGTTTSNPTPFTLLTCACALADITSDSLDTIRNPSGGVGPEDLDAFIAAFLSGNLLADVANDSLDTVFNPNGVVGPEDLDAFIASFVAGC